MSLIGRAARSMITSGSVWGDVHKSPYNAEFGLTYRSGGMSYSGINVTPEVAMTFSAVFACIRLISDTISTLPIDVLQRYPTGRYQRPSPGFILQPNPEMTWPTFLQQLVVARLTDGNAYFIPVYVNGRCVEVWPLDPKAVDIGRTKSGELLYAIHDKPPIPAEEIVHLRGMTLPGYPKGLSPIECARHTIGLALSAEKHGSKLFSQGTAFDTVIKTPGPLSRDDAKRLALNFMESHSGSDKAFSPVVLTGGAELQKFSMTCEEVQFLSTRQFQVEEICRWFGVPPHRIAMTEKTTSWGTGIESQNMAFLQDAITPELVRLETALNPLVKMENPDYYVRFNVAGLLRGDSQARKDFYQTMFGVGALSPDEIRELEDMNPLPGGLGKEHYAPLNYGPIGKKEEKKPPPPAFPPKVIAMPEPTEEDDDTRD